MAKQRKSLADIEKQVHGGEPIFDGIVMSQLDMIKALNWYNQNRESKQSLKYIGDYVKKYKLKVEDSTISQQHPTYGFLCRLKSNGAIFSDRYQEKFDSFLEKLKIKVKRKKVVEKPVVKTTTIQDKVNEKVNDIAGELDGTIDDYIKNKFKKVPSPYAIMHNNLKPNQVNRIVEMFKKERAVYDEVLNTKDKDLIEGYSNFNKIQLKKLISYCDLIITDAIKIRDEAKPAKKARTVKRKTPEQLTSKLNYCQTNDDYNLKSVSPKDIIGATQLWVFNVKYKKLGIYNANDASGFSVKGSTLINYNETTSITKALRKPNDVLGKVTSGGKLMLKNIMKEINTKESPLNGRINGETILLRIIK